MNLKLRYILVPVIQGIVPVTLLFFGPYIGLHPKGAHGRLVQLIGGAIIVSFLFIVNFKFYQRDKRFQDVSNAIRSRFQTNNKNETVLVSETELQTLGGKRGGR